MTLSDLIEQLTTLMEDVGGDAEVLVAYQPNYPMQVSVDEIAANDPMEDFLEEYGVRGAVPEEDLEQYDEAHADAEEAERRVYIGTGWSNGYLESGMKSRLGW